jgi:hypothetical protein
LCVLGQSQTGGEQQRNANEGLLNVIEYHGGASTRYEMHLTYQSDLIQKQSLTSKIPGRKAPRWCISAIPGPGFLLLEYRFRMFKDRALLVCVAHRVAERARRSLKSTRHK